MKFYSKEADHDYANYQFGYTQWAEPEDAESPEAAYAEGFLPYSAQPGLTPWRFYRARSLRVPLDAFSLHKKRRYEQRQWAAAGLSRQLLSKTEFLSIHGDSAADYAQLWMRARFAEPYLSPQRFRYILSAPFLSHVLCWYLDHSLTAFAFIVTMPGSAHYWFVFYQPSSPSLPSPGGHGYLIDFLHWANAASFRFAYLGTAYHAHSHYKSRGILPIQFWDADHWCNDRSRLADLQSRDGAKHKS